MTLLRKVHTIKKIGVHDDMYQKLSEHMIEPEKPIHQKIYEIKKGVPLIETQEEHAQHTEKLDLLQNLLAQLSKKIESKDTNIEHINKSLRDVQTVIEKISSYVEEQKAEKLTARMRQLQQIEQQIALFETKLAEASKHYREEALFPIKEKIDLLREKHQELIEQEKTEAPEPEYLEEKGIAEEIKSKIEEMELPREEPSLVTNLAERKIEEEVAQLSEDIAKQEVKLDLPDFILPEEEELALPSPFPEIDVHDTGTVPMPVKEELPLPEQKKASVIDSLISELKRRLSKA